ncbi:carbohydrate ABC transporter permease [Paenibacillus nasutitermitis]|uniref:ABC transporter permease protein YtcP n=1 Tax=Paenibacillus nasutitermitis TaxID=1652958 RepID=A0A916Z6V6_9BACL|nr:carbohydrate ABC transporter permease [Paenibacillus nasutitermitis]GGD79106.1 putative ABC transporter permease protein YtcP [Paenibacillus nasutitermitis]
MVGTVALKDRAYMFFVYAFLIGLCVVVVFPLLYVVSVSLTPYSEVMKYGGFLVIPRNITFAAYKAFLSDRMIPHAYSVTIFITVVGTFINLLLTSMMAYPLTKKYLPGRNFFLLLIVFTTLFGGGMIPTYLIVKATGLLDSVWAMIIPSAIGSFNLLVMKAFYENLPESLDEAARIDGAGETSIMLRIVLPLSMPIMATVGLFYAVGHWNEFFAAIIYISDRKLHPLQVILQTILKSTQNTGEINVEETLPTVSLQMAAVVLTALPIIIVYPFIQQYFTKGVLLGSVKG